MSVGGNRRRQVAALIAVALLAAGCGDDDGGAESSDGEATAPTGASVEQSGATTASSGADGGDGDGEYCNADRVGGDIVSLVSPPNVFTGLDPLQLFGSGAYGGDYAGAFYGTVIRYDALTGEYHPWIAESWEPNDDNSVWTLTIRDDVTFGNGDPFTVQHIAAHLERMADSSVVVAAMAQLVTDVEIVNDHEMVVTLESSFDFPFMMSSQLGWVPNKDLVEQRGDEFHGNPVGGGAGPYELQRLSDVPGESMVLTAKDDWWGDPVCIQRIEFRNVADETAAMEALLNDEADTLFMNNQVDIARLDEQGLMAYTLPVGSLGYIMADQGISGRADTPFQDVRVREALQLAIDYDVMHQRIFEGTDPAPTSALVPASAPLWPGVEGPPTDPERAAELVQETIDEGVWDGSFTFTHSPEAAQADTAVLLEGMWEAVGMDVTLDPDPNSAARVIVEHDFEVAMLGMGIATQPWIHLNLLECDSPRKRVGYCNPDMDAALQTMQEAVTVEEKQAALGQVQEIWNETFPLAIYRHGVNGTAAQPEVHGLTFGPRNVPFYDRAWVEPS